MNGIIYNYLFYLIMFFAFGSYLVYTIINREKGDFSRELIVKIMICLLAVVFSCAKITITTIDIVNEDFVEKTIICEKVVRNNRINWRINYVEKDSGVRDYVDCPLFTSFYLKEGNEYVITVTLRSNILLEAKELYNLNE